MSAAGQRPRSVGPARTAALLYGDWGTSKAYVLGIAFGIAAYSSFWILVAMAALTALVGLNYYWVCCKYPDGGGVYSALRDRSKLFAVLGALLLIADYLVTASLSVLEGFNYISHMFEHLLGPEYALSAPSYWAIGLLLILGAVNWWGPRHSGTISIILAIPAAIAAMSIAVLAIPHVGEAHIAAPVGGLGAQWMLFASIVLALSGVEAVSNMTGVMTADPKKNPSDPDTVKRTSGWAIGIVATEVVVLTVILALAMHAMPGLTSGDSEAMLGRMAEHYGREAFGEQGGSIYATAVGLVMALLLFSAGNTAIIGMISVFYLMASDREMPAVFGRLNRHGVPTLPLVVAAVMPGLLLLYFTKVEGLAALYAIGVVGAITLNLGGCATNKHLHLNPVVRFVMGTTALIMLAIWLTIAYEKHDAVVFAVTIIAVGLLARSFVHERRDVAEESELREIIESSFETPDPEGDAPRVLVALRGVTDTLRFAAEEARLRKGRLGVLFVREVNVLIPITQTLREDPEALKILKAARAATEDDGVPLDFFYRPAPDTAQMILKTTLEYKADFVVMGASAEGAIAHLLRGSLVETMAKNLPHETRLLIYSWMPSKRGKRG